MKQTVTFALLVSGVILVLVVGLTSASLRSTSATGDPLVEHLMDLENEIWSAWANADGASMDRLLSDDALLVIPPGVFDRAQVIEDTESGECDVASFDLRNPRLIRLAEDAALVTYDGYQQAVCGDVELPDHVFSTSVYVRRGGEWKNAFYQETVPVRIDG